MQAFDRAGALGEQSFAKAGRARILRGQGRLEEALKLFEEVTREYPLRKVRHGQDAQRLCEKCGEIRGRN